MKKLLTIAYIFVLFLTSCKSIIKDVDYEQRELIKVYGYCIETEQIDEVYIDYSINDYIDVFELYTIYQNNLPLNYTSMGNSNIELLDARVEENVVCYEVDRFIYFSDDLEIFLELLKKMNNELGYLDTKIILNGKTIA